MLDCKSKVKVSDNNPHISETNIQHLNSHFGVQEDKGFAMWSSDHWYLRTGVLDSSNFSITLSGVWSKIKHSHEYLSFANAAIEQLFSGVLLGRIILFAASERKAQQASTNASTRSFKFWSFDGFWISFRLVVWMLIASFNVWQG